MNNLLNYRKKISIYRQFIIAKNELLEANLLSLT